MIQRALRSTGKGLGLALAVTSQERPVPVEVEDSSVGKHLANLLLFGLNLFGFITVSTSSVVESADRPRIPGGPNNHFWFTYQSLRCGVEKTAGRRTRKGTGDRTDNGAGALRRSGTNCCRSYDTL